MALYINFKVERLETQGIVDKNNGNCLIKGLVRPSDWPPDTEAAGGTESWSSLIVCWSDTEADHRSSRLIVRQGDWLSDREAVTEIAQHVPQSVCSSFQTLKHKKDKKKLLSTSYSCNLWDVFLASFFSRYITNSRLMTMMNIFKFSRVSSMSCRAQRSSTIT